MKCDFCGKTEKVMYDGKTKLGPWANMCQPHYDENGIGLGTGKGQKYPEVSLIGYVKVEG